MASISTLRRRTKVDFGSMYFPWNKRKLREVIRRLGVGFTVPQISEECKLVGINPTYATIRTARREVFPDGGWSLGRPRSNKDVPQERVAGSGKKEGVRRRKAVPVREGELLP